MKKLLSLLLAVMLVFGGISISTQNTYAYHKTSYNIVNRYRTYKQGYKDGYIFGKKTAKQHSNCVMPELPECITRSYYRGFCKGFKTGYNRNIHYYSASTCKKALIKNGWGKNVKVYPKLIDLNKYTNGYVQGKGYIWNIKVFTGRSLHERGGVINAASLEITQYYG